MPEQIISSSGVQYGLIINSDGTIGISGALSVDSVFVRSGTIYQISGNTYVTSGNISVTNLGSESWIKNFGDLGSTVLVDNLYPGSESWIKNFGNLGSSRVIEGSVFVMEDVPTAHIFNNELEQLEYIVSGTATGVTGSTIGSIIKFIGTGSYVKVLTYSNDLITKVGSWV